MILEDTSDHLQSTSPSANVRQEPREWWEAEADIIYLWNIKENIASDVPSKLDI